MTDKEQKGKVLVAGPYFGEFGWEVFCWQPLLRHHAMTGKHEKVIVYAGPGRGLLYRFADEIRQLDDMPRHEPECLIWHRMGQHVKDAGEMTQRMVNACAAEFGKERLEVMHWQSIQPANNPHYPQGLPDLLWGEPDGRFRPRGEGKPLVALCVRDRGLSDFRNWGRERWVRLSLLLTKNCDVVLLGRTQEPWILDSPYSLLNQTSVDDLIRIFGNHAAVAVGGSTGTIHLASRCGTPHIVWGNAKVTRRIAETNWFGAPARVYEWGWEPEPEMVAKAVETCLDTGEFWDA
jgi:ADP-heptose:LPS heptosyltransferase